MKNLSIIIIGGGVIGLSIGWQLSRDGLSVDLLEAGNVGRKASWAAAGMLAPYSEAVHANSDLLEMGEKSLALYPRFLQELEEDSCFSLSHEMEGTLWAALNGDEQEWLYQKYRQQKAKGMDIHWLSRDEAREMEPFLTSHLIAALWIPHDRQINNRHLLIALKEAFLSRHGKICENARVQKIETGVNKKFVVKTHNQSYEADLVINASGAWSSQIQNIEVPESIYLRPVKGQILCLHACGLTLKQMIRTRHVYLVPKQDGTIRLGATQEEQGFDEAVTAGAVLELLQNGCDVVPAIAQCEMAEILTSLRPTTANLRPYVGPSETQGLYHAIGHGRAGILLAPLTAYRMKENLYAHFFER